MHSIPLVYSKKYFADLQGHVFPIEKYRLIVERLEAEGLLGDVVAPEPATREQLELVHTPEYLDDLFEARWTARTASSEMALTPEIARAFQLGAGRSDGKLKHTYPMGPLGHEGGGTVVAMGPGVERYTGGGQVAIGDRVGSLIYPTYTDYWVTHIEHVQPIPDGVSFEVGCLYEPLGCAAWAAIHMGVKLGDTVAVNGVGFAGNIMLQGALKSGASLVIAVDVVPEKLEVAKALGADVVINAMAEDAVAVVDEITKGEVTVKELSSGVQRRISRKTLAEEIRKLLGS